VGAAISAEPIWAAVAVIWAAEAISPRARVSAGPATSAAPRTLVALTTSAAARTLAAFAISAEALTLVALAISRGAVISGRFIISPAGHILPAVRSLDIEIIFGAIIRATEGFTIFTTDGGMRTLGGLAATPATATGLMCAPTGGGTGRIGITTVCAITASTE
jgi:hypothetical protein